MRTRTTSSISGGPDSQLVPLELEEVSQHSHWSVPLQKPDSLDKSPSCFGFPWDSGTDTGQPGPLNPCVGSQPAAKGWGEQTPGGCGR